MSHYTRVVNVFFKQVGRQAGQGTSRLDQIDGGQQLAEKAPSPQQDIGLKVLPEPLKVSIVGSGNWASAVSKIIGNNVKTTKKFASPVKMWVFEEIVNGRKLTDIINTDHENVKYLPGYRLPENVIATPSLSQAVQDADLLVFAFPHQFIRKICDELAEVVPRKARGLTLIKGIDEGPESLKLISDIIREKVNIDVSVLMGANLANEVAAEQFCETTIGSKVLKNGLLFKELFQTPNFRVTVVEDPDTVELCGALKNIVAMGSGFCDSFCCGNSTKAAVIRLGLMEMISFVRTFSKGQVSIATFLESCGVADLISTCYGGRNRKVAEAFGRTGKSLEELEKEMLKGQKLQGPHTSAQVYRILKQKGLLDKFPLFTVVYQICYEGRAVTELIPCLQNHPEHRRRELGKSPALPHPSQGHTDTGRDSKMVACLSVILDT
ncbi:glycerol-3-phosphate dehydrogenase 1-like protein isoform X1 [Rattus rattus]|uniref:glycerol-3-phosphate dehydrogenase 1-like protein isoform X1 n=2 Tax=Rattus rattus TaxID=10117 RepID=UPI0013F303C2|nr:glycerol-3-phosphate dehydrogenase 1-like protein isoform X1 [Rattus rattus]